MTQGVLERVESVAREQAGDGLARGDGKGRRPPFRSLVGLQQIVAESVGRGVNTKGVQGRYMRLVEELGSELHILTAAAIGDVAAVGGERVAEGVARVRKGDIVIEPGYDGVYGRVRVWPDDGAGERQLRLG